MPISSKWLFAALSLMLASGSALANDHLVRWTGTEDADGSVSHVLENLSRKLNRPLSKDDFVVQEDRDLAFNHYKRLVQVVDNVPVHGKSIRIWTELGSDKAVQVEADLETSKLLIQSMLGLRPSGKSSRQIREEFTSEQTAALVRRVVRKHRDDPYVHGIDWKDEWDRGTLLRFVKVRGKRGYHHIRIDVETGKVVSREYREFPQADQAKAEPQELSIPVQVFPIYEETEDGTRLTRVPEVLKHILPVIPEVQGDIYAPLRTQRYLGSMYNPDLAETEAGRAAGYWSMPSIKRQAAKLREGLPLVANDFSKGLLLHGQYATINIHPDAIKQFGPASFETKFTAPFFPNWLEVIVDGSPEDEMVPGLAYAGKPLFSAQEAFDRPARRLADHNPGQYMNDGFDEIQVYYAVDTLFEELHARGFKDPELSTRPFNAFLFNPDVAYRDNAYYTDDTINFTTYSPKLQNMARDNSTIWHELGHGVMDRLMGDQIELADTGGLSEGMADFVAQLVVQAVTQGSPFPGAEQFRIKNQTGFYLTNEVHDDGEAYGGAMNDFMEAVIRRDGMRGLDKVTDVVLEAMCLTRDYPGLTAPEWFNHILFADSLGRPGLREPGELKADLLAALAGRNFKLDGGKVASFTLVNAGSDQEVVAGKPGSRQAPILVKLAETESAGFQLRASLSESDVYSFHYPVKVRVQFNGSPLQGAIHWVGEENGSLDFTLNSPADTATIPLQVTGKCQEVNRADGSCVDYVHVQVWNNGETRKPVAKKRFYLRVKN